MIPDLFADYNRIYLAAPSHAEGMAAMIAEIDKEHPDARKGGWAVKSMGYFHPDWGVSNVIGLVRLDVSEEIRDENYERLWREGRGKGMHDLIITYSRKNDVAIVDELNRLASKPQWTLFSLADGSLTVVRALEHRDDVAA